MTRRMLVPLLRTRLQLIVQASPCSQNLDLLHRLLDNNRKAACRQQVHMNTHSTTISSILEQLTISLLFIARLRNVRLEDMICMKMAQRTCAQSDLHLTLYPSQI
jgi:hypothetical protein